MLTDILSWAAVMALPGPDIVAIGTQVSRHGHRAGFATATGATIGVATWSILSLAGITALLTAIPALSVMLPVLGSSVLIVLGLLAIKGVLSARRAATQATMVNSSSPESSVADLRVPAGSTPAAPTTPATESTTSTTASAQHAPVWFRAFRLGLITNLSNPSLGVFQLFFHATHEPLLWSERQGKYAGDLALGQPRGLFSYVRSYENRLSYPSCAPSCSEISARSGLSHYRYLLLDRNYKLSQNRKRMPLPQV